MPDITMCDNQDCEQRSKCYRAMATPSSYQSWAIFESKDCKYFIEYVKHTRKAERAVDW